VRTLLLLDLGARFHLLHHVHGPAIDYATIVAASFASWAGLPGPGETVLIAAAVIAAKHKLDITPVVLVAFLGATGGGVAGWLAGMKGGRVVLTAPGPFQQFRINAVRRGDLIFRRITVIAVLLTPSWVAGIHHVRPRVYLPVNAISAAAWAAGVGVGAYYVGPPVIEFVDDLGWIATTALVALLVGVVGGELLRRRRRRRRRAAQAPE
jgi:membrane protein DedA with SNARE-associated domain